MTDWACFDARPRDASMARGTRGPVMQLEAVGGMDA